MTSLTLSFDVHTSRNDDVCVHARWSDELCVRWLDERLVLLDDTFDVTTAVLNVAEHASREPHIRVGVHEDLHVKKLQKETHEK